MFCNMAEVFLECIKIMYCSFSKCMLCKYVIDNNDG